MICCPRGVGDVVEKEDIAESVVFGFEKGEKDGISARDGKDVLENAGVAKEGDPGPADEETALEVGGSRRGNEEPAWRGFMCEGRSQGSGRGESRGRGWLVFGREYEGEKKAEGDNGESIVASLRGDGLKTHAKRWRIGCALYHLMIHTRLEGKEGRKRRLIVMREYEKR